MNIVQLVKRLGPGLLYAATAVGVSHLVQSTRAGAIFNLDLIVFVILFNVLKYPFFKMGVLYAHHERTSLVEGYKTYSKGAWWIFIIQSILTMFIVIALIAKVTMGLIPAIWDFFFETSLNMLWVQYALLIGGFAVLWLGGLSVLNQVIKWVILALSISVVIAVLMVLGSGAELSVKAPFNFEDIQHISFLIALGGWMPAPMDVSIWQSVWIAESAPKSRSSQVLDFNIGYWLTMVLAIMFLVLGAYTFKGDALNLPEGAVGFSTGFLNIFKDLYGTWGFLLMGLAALLTMFSTFISVLDAYPRSLSHAIHPDKKRSLTFYYKGLLTLTVLLVLLILHTVSDFAMLVDGVTILSFVLVPVLAASNWWVSVKAQKASKSWVFGKKERIGQWVSLLLLILFSLFYLVHKFLMN